jgi:queuine tRNA-ribosyltransferase
VSGSRPDPDELFGDAGLGLGDPLLRGDPRADVARFAPRGAPSAADGDPAPGTVDVLATDGDARATRLWTAHGPVHTPCFMPVGTYGNVKGLDPADLAATGSQVVLANAYHLGHRPGPAAVRAFGGVHGLMNWAGPMLTDSGGYQVFSLRGLQRIDEGGVDYQTHFDGSRHRMTPRSVLEVQAALGPDICMVLDHCPPGDAGPADMRAAMDRTSRWAREALEARAAILHPDQLCFGIVQGGTDLTLRAEHLATIAGLEGPDGAGGTRGFDGIALGGLSVGEPVPQTHAVLAAVGPTLPRERPRYVMGIGTPRDLLAAVAAGIDMFDCVIPSRHARNGQLLTWAGPLSIRGSRMRADHRPVDPHCGCPTCERWTRAHLRHLHVHDDPLYVRLATVHNIYMLHEWVAALRRAIREGRFAALHRRLSAVISAIYGD